MAEQNNTTEWFDHILNRKLLDVWDLAVCEQVSKDLQKKSNTTALWAQYLERLFRQFDQQVTKIEKYLKPLKQREKDSIQKKKEEEIEKKKKKAKHDLSLKNTEYKAEDTALDYLINTMGLFKKFSQKERQIVDNYARKEYVLLMVLMNDQLQETLEMVMDIYAEKRQMTDNFEIFDQTLRRYLVQITIMFPLTESKKGSEADVKDHPSVVISDPEARKIWESRIGPKAYCCTFDSFYRKVFEQDYAKECKNKDLVYYLGYFLNFPKDNIVTTYKWHLLTALFGPYQRFMVNFKKYVLGKGFGGLINRLQSEELLKKYPKHIMMRFSRTNPSYMAFSYNVDGYIAHITNNPSWWAKDPFMSIIKKDTSIKKEDAVPIDTFLEELFFEKGFALVPLRIDSSAVKNMLGLKDYASNMNGYLENHPDESASEDEHVSEEEPEDGGSYQAYERTDDPDEDVLVNRSSDMPLRGYSTLGSTAPPMSSSPAKGMYVEALNASVDSNLNNSTDGRKSVELKGYGDETMDEYTDTKTNTNENNGSHSVPAPDHRYVGLDDEADDKVGLYKDDRFKNVDQEPSGYDTYKDTPVTDVRSSGYDAYDVPATEEKSGEDDLVQEDELSRIQQEAKHKQEDAEKETREQEEAERQQEEERLAREKAEQEERDRVARELAEKEAREQAEREEQEKVAREQAKKQQREEQDRLAKEQTEREEQERLAREKAEQEERDRVARELAEKEEHDRLAREKAEQDERDRLAREKEEHERLAREKTEQEERERQVRAENDKREREAREKAEHEAAQAKGTAAQKPITPASTPRGPPADVVPGSFTYEQLITKPEGADVKKLEAYLSDESFESALKMKRDEFYKMPQWKQLEAKKKAKLF